MLGTYSLHGEVVDSLELKALLVTRGINVPGTIYERFGKTHRLSAPGDPMACDCLLLPDHTVVHMAHVGTHSPFSLAISENDRPCLRYKDAHLTEIAFPPSTRFYDQHTSGGMPFKGTAVLQGVNVLSFPYLWPCDYAQAGYACQFCHSGNLTEEPAREGAELPRFPTPRDVAEIVGYAVNEEQVATHVQITGGSSYDPEAEVHCVVKILQSIDDLVGLDTIPGEILVYTSPPVPPALIDEVLRAGADRVACDIEVWDGELARRICPGKSRFAGKQRQLDLLFYIAEKYGPAKACSAFVVGVEPAESFLAAARYLAARGVVPIASIWLPHGRPVDGRTEAPGLDFYRRILDGLAEIYDTYGCEPPGDVGFNVCVCRDTWNHRRERKKRACSSHAEELQQKGGGT